MFPHHCERTVLPNSRARRSADPLPQRKLDCSLRSLSGSGALSREPLAPRNDVDGLFAGTTAVCAESYLSRRTELLQCFSDDQTLRDSRKRSTGVEQPNASKRCSSTPLHWKPHFSRMLREAGLATRAPANMLAGKLLEEIVDRRARGLGAKTLAPMLDAKPVAELGRVRSAMLMPTMPTGAKLCSIRNAISRGSAAVKRTNSTHVLQIGMRQAAGILGDAAVVGETRNRFYVRERRPAQAQPFGLEDARTGLAQCRVKKFLQHRPAPVMRLKVTQRRKKKGEAGFPPPLLERSKELRRFVRTRRT